MIVRFCSHPSPHAWTPARISKTTHKSSSRTAQQPTIDISSRYTAMTLTTSDFVLPRSGGPPRASKSPIPGPSEAAFTEAFGALLPPAKFLKTSNGKSAYYEIPPFPPGHSSETPDRVLFIHGVQTPAIGMLPLAHALHSSFSHAHFALFDLWGHGLSDTPVLPYDASLFHQLLDALLNHLQWPSAHLVGYSFGASLSVGYAASRSSRVQSFTLVAPGGLIRSSLFTPKEQAHLRNGCDEVAARKWVLQFLEDGELVVPADSKERIGRGEVIAEAVRDWQMRVHPGHPASVVAVFRDGGALDNHAGFARALHTGIPSLVVLGEKDDLCSEQELREFGFEKVFVVPQAGHGVIRERVPEVAELISNFWTKLG
ncbi:alpha/beta-hydrolase [Clathrospora elynae]|uniref:Alpha/beta-hydrolase n=1 Tax=Clathrospora elynae TaxID=706981 RepID=A0A6A5S867_9PLEO|nr:alpha/beta-hydrolase [Clathrospora elynae]